MVYDSPKWIPNHRCERGCHPGHVSSHGGAPGLATWSVTRDCDMFLANLSSAEPGTRQGRFREVKRPSLLFPEQLGMSEDKRSNFTLFLTSSVTRRDPITVSAPLQLHLWKGGITPYSVCLLGLPRSRGTKHEEETEH